MAGPPRVPPPLPSQRTTIHTPGHARGAPIPGPLPGGADPRVFDPNAERISTRDVQRATGRSEGVWIHFDSTNVYAAKVDPEYDLNGKKTGVGTIYIEFLSGAVYEYQNRPMGDWFDLIESSSKGRFTYYEVRGPGKSVPGMGLWPSTKIREATRSAETVAKMRKQREPRTEQQKKRTYTRGGKRGAYGAGGAYIR